MSARAGIVVLVPMLLWCACGRAVPVPPTLEEVRARADELAGREAWALAAERYAAAFALVDPVPENAVQRAELALQRARALARAGWCVSALEWFRIAERLDRDLWYVAYERARLHDGDCPETYDPGAARREYESFLHGHDIHGNTAHEAEAAEARRRLDRLPVPQR